MPNSYRSERAQDSPRLDKYVPMTFRIERNNRCAGSGPFVCEGGRLSRGLISFGELLLMCRQLERLNAQLSAGETLR
jgi:hypothetical protein